MQSKAAGKKVHGKSVELFKEVIKLKCEGFEGYVE